MYDFLTAFVTIGVIAFLIIYNTAFLTVVTLGGTVLGCALLGLCSAVLTVVLQKLTDNRLLRCGADMAGCSFIIVQIINCLPGWTMRPDTLTPLFLLVLCSAVTLLNEYIIERK